MIDPTAVLGANVQVGSGCRVWGQAYLGDGVRLGDDCTIGRGASLEGEVHVGDRVKVQSHALLYGPATIGDGVFVGPAVVLTNDLHPRAVSPDGSPKQRQDWDPVGVVVGDGASLGARAVCVAPVTIGRWALVAAGAVVTRPVPDFALVAGVPARQIGWVGRAGHRLVTTDIPGVWRCPATDARYVEDAGSLTEEVE